MKDTIIGYINGIAQEKGVQPGNSDDLFSCGVLDSLGLLMLLSFLQDSLGIDFCDDDIKAENFATIDSIIEFCERKTQG